MELIGTEYCDFVVSTEVDQVVVSVKKDPEFIKKLFAKLRMFYFRFLLPNFCRASQNGIMMQGIDGSYREISEEVYNQVFKKG
jgi:hypothetical protein